MREVYLFWGVKGCQWGVKGWATRAQFQTWQCGPQGHNTGGAETATPGQVGVAAVQYNGLPAAHPGPHALMHILGRPCAALPCHLPTLTQLPSAHLLRCSAGSQRADSDDTAGMMHDCPRPSAARAASMNARGFAAARVRQKSRLASDQRKRQAVSSRAPPTLSAARPSGICASRREEWGAGVA